MFSNYCFITFLVISKLLSSIFIQYVPDGTDERSQESLEPVSINIRKK